MRTIVFALAFMVALPSINTMSLAQDNGPGKNETVSGMTVITFGTQKGSIKVYLPGDNAAGDTISGTVTADPVGKDQKEKEKNSGELFGYVLQFEQQRWPVSGGVVHKLILRPGISSVVLMLLDRSGKKIDDATYPVASAPMANTLVLFAFPTVGQVGRPVQVQGPFDGDSSNTSVKVGGEPAKIFAESPRKLWLESPREVVGPTRIEVSDNGKSTTGAFRNLKIDLSAPKTSLLKGESTELHVQVNGLEGLTKSVQVQLQNQSPSTLNLEGGNTQTFVIPTSAIATNGTYVTTRTLTGVSNGTFSITATVLAQPGNL